jgi:type IV pilus assembly protein PilF
VGLPETLVRASVLLAALLMACRHGPSEKELQASQIHFDLGVQAQSTGDVQGAVAEFQEAIKLDPRFPEAHNGLGILLHLSFQRHEDAITHYKKALELRPDYSEAKNNLGNVYLDQGRFDEAIALYEEALNDMRYSTPFMAQGNLGWALYRKGEVQRGIDYIKAAVTTNPKYCGGFRNLGLIYDQTGKLEDACRQFTRYRETCPDSADASYREGLCQSRQGKPSEARLSFAACVQKATSENLKDECRRLGDRLR